MPAAKPDPRALHHTWELKGEFELVFVEPPKGARTKRKPMGQVVTWRDTEKGKVDNKVDQVLCFLTCSTQDQDAAPFALQARKLDYSKLSPSILKEVKKGLTASPTLIQISRKPCSAVTVLFFHSEWCVHRQDKDRAQEVDGCQCSGDDKPEADAVGSGEEEDESDASADSALLNDASGDDDDEAEAKAVVQVPDAPEEEEVELLPHDASHPVKVASPNNPKGLNQKKGQPKQADPKEVKHADAKGSLKNTTELKKDQPKEDAQPAVEARVVKKKSKRKALESQDDDDVSAARGRKKLKLSIQGYDCINADVFAVPVPLILMAVCRLCPISFPFLIH